MGEGKYEFTEKTKEEIIEKYGLTNTESSKNSLFRGDFGTSINFSILIPSLILLVAIVFLLYLLIKRRMSQ